MFYTVKTSVAFFAHQGQMCFSLDRDIVECNCDFRADRRPSWMPPPENILT